MLIQPIIDIPQICHKKGINHVVISPGSRNAHITIAFARHPEIKTYIIPDERAAAYIAVGMAQSLQKTVAIVCTSGTAVLNYYPAIAEAYYQNIPLLVLTADRPSKWIDKNDGQTIRQNEVYSNHIKKSYTFPESFAEKKAVALSQKIIDEAINLSEKSPKGPVHINIPISEPFYPENHETISYSDNLLINEADDEKSSFQLRQELVENLNNKKLAIVAGQYSKNEALTSILSKISTQKKIPIFADSISNAHTVESAITFHDSFDFKNNPDLIPEYIISFGRSIISKKLKLALRNFKDLKHIHISENDFPADTYLSLSEVIQTSQIEFFNALLNSGIHINQNYQSKLLSANDQANKKVTHLLKDCEFGEFKALQIMAEEIPVNAIVHLANSMSVRYFNILGTTKNVGIFSNRGTSGIDGCTSTALGHALHNKKMNILLTGDMAFFYDRNALWHHHIPPNLKIVIFNNHGGGIFRLIDGPNKQPELEHYFETHQSLTAKNTAKDFGLDYFQAKNEKELRDAISYFLKNEKASILEIETRKEINQKVFEMYKKAVS